MLILDTCTKAGFMYRLFIQKVLLKGQIFPIKPAEGRNKKCKEKSAGT